MNKCEQTGIKHDDFIRRYRTLLSQELISRAFFFLSGVNRRWERKG